MRIKSVLGGVQMLLKFAIVAYLINFSASNTADSKVQFEFKEFDFKETSKNVS